MEEGRTRSLEQICEENPLRFMQAGGQTWVSAQSVIDLLRLAAVDKVPDHPIAKAKAAMCQVIADALAFEMVAHDPEIGP